MTQSLQEAADAFYAAGNQLLAGDPEAFAAIWSDSDDISHLGPTGAICVGRKAVMEEFAKESTMGFRGTLVADERRFMETSDVGYLVCVERTSGMTQAGEQIRSDIRSTTVFRRKRGTGARCITTPIASRVESWRKAPQPLPVKARSRPATWGSTGRPAGSSSPSWANRPAWSQ
jgi:ketosteroid isomerase-like protein